MQRCHLISWRLSHTTPGYSWCAASLAVTQPFLGHLAVSGPPTALHRLATCWTSKSQVNKTALPLPVYHPLSLSPRQRRTDSAFQDHNGRPNDGSRGPPGIFDTAAATVQPRWFHLQCMELKHHLFSSPRFNHNKERRAGLIRRAGGRDLCPTLPTLLLQAKPFFLVLSPLVSRRPEILSGPFA